MRSNEINNMEMVFLAEQLSNYSYSPIKCMNGRCPTKVIVIGDWTTGWILLDLGRSVNPLPYTIYQKLGLGELKPIRSVL